MKKVWKFLHSSNPITWFGHAAMMVGLYYLFGEEWKAPVAAFGYREVSDLASFAFDGVRPKGKEEWKKKLEDGAGDFFLALLLAISAVAAGKAYGLAGVGMFLALVAAGVFIGGKLLAKRS